MKKTAILLMYLFLGMCFLFGQGFGGMADLLGPDARKAMDRAEDGMDKLDGRIPMRFFNAIDRSPIAGGRVEIENVGTFTTNSGGKIVFPVIPDGNYTLIFSKEGFITTPIDFRVMVGQVIFNWYSISPGFTNRDYRIVLVWGEIPADLDLHFVKTGGTGNYHISYFNLRSAEDGTTTLDRDDRNGHGPETITVGRIDPRAVYNCYVHDYTNRNNTNSTQMAREGAVIRVYSQNKLLHTFNIPSNGVGTRWNVFRIENGVIVPVNQVIAR